MRSRAQRAARRCLAPVAALAIMLAVGAAWAQYGDRTMTRTPDHGKPGTVITITGTGCIEDGKPYDSALLMVSYKGDPRRSENYTDVPVHDDGTFEGKVAVPDDAPPGDYVVSVDCSADDMVHQVGREPFTVDGTSPSPTPSATPPSHPNRMPTPSRTHNPTSSPSPRVATSPSRSATHVAAPPTRRADVTTTPIAADGPTSGSGRGAIAFAAAALLVADVAGLIRVNTRPRRRLA